jgi:hypothetical protein
MTKEAIMAGPISVQCPHCQSKLKLKAAPPEGKKVGCPKCKKPFPVKAPPKKKKADDEDFLDALDDLSEDDYEPPEDENSEEQEEEAPVRRTRKSSSASTKKGAVKGKKGRSKKSSAGPMLAIIGGSVAALLLLGGLVWFLMNLPGAKGISSASGEFIAFLPSDADVYFTARPADLIASPVLASLVQKPEGQKGLAEFEKAFGFPAQEIEHFFLAVKVDPLAPNPVAQPGAPMAGNPMMGLPGMPDGIGRFGGNPAGVGDVVLVLKLKQPYAGKTLDQVTQAYTAKSHNGISYYVDTRPNGGAMIFGNDRCAIITEAKWIERIIDRKDQPENNNLLAYLAKDQHLTLVTHPKGNMAQTAMPPGFSPSMLPNPEMQKLVQEIASVRMDLKLPGSVDLKVALTCKTDSAAQQAHAETTKQIEQLKQQAAFLKLMLPDIDQVINSVQVSLAGPTLSLSASVPSSMVDKFKQQAGLQTDGVSPSVSISTNPAVSPGNVPPTISLDPSTSNRRPETQADVEQAVARSHSRNLLKQVLLAFHNHHDQHMSFPAAFNVDPNGRPLLSWRVHLLPLVNEKSLYDRFHLNEPWDSEHNKTLIPLIPKAYCGFNEPDLVKEGRTRILVPIGPGMAFEGKDPLHFRDFLDGTSNTLMAVTVEPSAAVIWTKPDDLVVDPKMPLKNLSGPQADSFTAAFADGSAREFKVTIAADVLNALFTRKGGESLPPGAF